jgi:hypothetical protein
MDSMDAMDSMDEFKAFIYARCNPDLPEDFKHGLIASILNDLKQRGLHRVRPDGTEEVQFIIEPFHSRVGGTVAYIPEPANRPVPFSGAPTMPQQDASSPFIPESEASSSTSQSQPTVLFRSPELRRLLFE